MSSSHNCKPDVAGAQQQSGSSDSLDIAPEDLERVKSVVAESEDEKYWFAASRDGNRESHYRGEEIATSSLQALNYRDFRPHVFREEAWLKLIKKGTLTSSCRPPTCPLTYCR